MTPKEAQSIITKRLYPSTEYQQRMELGDQAQINFSSSKSVSSASSITPPPMLRDDEELAYSYAEFPVESFHTLLDRAFYWKSHFEQQPQSQQHKETKQDQYSEEERESCQHLVEIGSGCSKLALYAALVLNGNNAFTETNSCDQNKK